MRQVTVKWAGGAFAQDIGVAGHRIRADEDVPHGGDDTGPEPHELLLAALGSCTAMTLKVYAERKGWPLTDVQVRLSGDTATGRLVITRELVIEGNLDADQRLRLVDIADKCPVHKSLSNPITIATTMVSA